MTPTLPKTIASLTLALLLMLSGCIGDPLDAEDQANIDAQIRAAIEQTFPLPEHVVIRTHVGDDLRFSTENGVAEIVAFYRDRYDQKGFTEQPGAEVSPDEAQLLFAKEGEQDVTLEVASREAGSEVHLFLSAAP